MKSIDKDVLAAYNLGIEKNRLRSGLGLIEFQRTKEIIQQTLPPAPAGNIGKRVSVGKKLNEAA